MSQMKWQGDYEVKVIYPCRTAKLLIILIVLNAFICCMSSKVRFSEQEIEWILASHIGVATLTCLLVFKFETKSESMLVVPAVGINVSSVNRLGQVNTEFFPRQLVQDVVIVEAIIMQKFSTYLAILYQDPTSGQKKIKPMFLKSRLKIEELKSIYQKVQENLKFVSEKRS
ncbi:phosphatidylinositol N-acetylglucosaminyltransferase subunit H-like [Saccostrea echinata]|uniref:phosphatidylinositol N-acetylglucosaminyltransferase subunit H-like n=1 Tax=Saccostrea echinata TaxID=191078 RepID=UPI002A81330C|nr:phosphatidylinositol N-acetylglucosaminyltransferase subunit H-like [Saccostrea echinata]